MRFSSCGGLPCSFDQLWDAMALLAKWFHFPPSEICALDWPDFRQWVQAAIRQAEQCKQ